MPTLKDNIRGKSWIKLNREPSRKMAENVDRRNKKYKHSKACSRNCTQDIKAREK